MSIQKIAIRGFRSLRDVTWSPGRLNVVIGPNGSGKSNLLRALALLQKAVQGKLANEIIAQGGMSALLWDDRADGIEWETTWDSSSFFTRDRTLTYHLALLRMLLPFNFAVVQEQLAKRAPGESGGQQGGEILIDRGFRRPVTIGGRMLSPEEAAGVFAEEETALSALSRLEGPALALTVREAVRIWGIYHDLKVDQSAPLRQPAVARLEQHVDPDGQNLVPVLHTLYSDNREFRESVDAAMRAGFGSEYEGIHFPPAADQRIQLRVQWRSLKSQQSMANLSDGTIRFLLLIAILCDPDPRPLVAIDEPETGLHPSMLPVVADLARAAAFRSQIILTTHSPEILDAFSEEAPTTTIAQPIGGETELKIVDGDELKRWLEKYTLGRLFRSGELEDLA